MNYDIIGVIPEDFNVPESIAKGVPIVISRPNSGASSTYKHLAAFLIGETYKESSVLDRVKELLFNFKTFRRPSSNQTTQHEDTKREVSDVMELRDNLTQDVKEELKREVMKRVKDRLRGKLNGV